MKRFKPGVRISIALTFRCNLHCPYCVVDKPNGKTPIVKESTLDELINFVKNKFPYAIREIKSEIEGLKLKSRFCCCPADRC